MNNVLGFPILTLVTFLPTLGAVLIALFLKKEQSKAIKYSAFAVAFIDFLVSIPLWIYYDPSRCSFRNYMTGSRPSAFITPWVLTAFLCC